ncbi:MAG: thermonuclease family protein [Candidatus Methanomethylicus sp.]|nr:thermonuclease family protein [Candidatus Methanomethylicus sp.]
MPFLGAALFVLFLTLCPLLVRCASYEIELSSSVVKVIDGDTFDISTGDRIRMADIDTPESGMPGYSEAKDYLNVLIGGKTVHLDIDDKYRHDTTGTRLVAVVYVDYNSTHYLNVNKAMAVGGYTELKDYDNEFNPYTWTLYVPMDQDASSGVPGLSLMLIFLAIAVIMVLLFLGSKGRRRRF